MKRLLPLLVLLLAQPAQAAYLGIIPAEVVARGTLTKLGENDYEFSVHIDFQGYYLPPPAFDPTMGFTVGYSPYPQLSWFGISTLVPGIYETSSGFGFGFNGDLKSTSPPEAPMSVWAAEDIAGENVFTGQGRFIAGELQGRATLLGDVPTEIGQSTAWAQTPEPTTFCLLGLGLLALTVRRKTSWV